MSKAQIPRFILTIARHQSGLTNKPHSVRFQHVSICFLNIQNGLIIQFLNVFYSNSTTTFPNLAERQKLRQTASDRLVGHNVKTG